MMKRLFLLLLLAAPLGFTRAASNNWGVPDGFVTDRAGVVDASHRQALEALLQELEQKTGAEVAVVTLKDLGGRDIESTAVDLFKAWGIGKKGKDNGVLILVSIADRKARIEVGYGLEGVVPDGAAGSIIRDQLGPAFRAGDYGGGLVSAAGAVAGRIAADAGVTLTGLPDQNTDDSDRSYIPGGYWAIFILLFLLLNVISLLSRPRRGFWGGFWGGMGGGWGGGGGFGGGGGGGFGGFGGGGSGGGGASGGW